MSNPTIWSKVPALTDRPCSKRYEKKKLLDFGKLLARRPATLVGFSMIWVTTAVLEDAIETTRKT